MTIPCSRRRVAAFLSILAVTLAVVAPRMVGAQRRVASTLEPGAVVRLRTVGVPETRIATLKGSSRDSVALSHQRGGGDVRLAWADVSRMEVLRGPRGRGEGLRRGARRGLVTGLVLGATVATVTLVGCSGESECFGVDHAALIGVPIVIGGATATGAVLGTAFPGRRWEALEVPRP